jgi:hypothetical protein
LPSANRKNRKRKEGDKQGKKTKRPGKKRNVFGGEQRMLPVEEVGGSRLLKMRPFLLL